MGVISEFKAFAVKGNVVDMAVGIIIGAAFGNWLPARRDVARPELLRLLPCMAIGCVVGVTFLPCRP